MKLRVELFLNYYYLQGTGRNESVGGLKFCWYLQGGRKTRMPRFNREKGWRFNKDNWIRNCHTMNMVRT